MASRERGFSFRHEGHMFFIYDHKKKKEEDDPTDAILYFYPRTVKTDNQIALVGGLIGITDFCLEFLPQEMPQIIKMSSHNFALLQHGDCIIGLAGPLDISTHFLVSHMQFLWSTFVFYQGSILALRQRHSEKLFLRELHMVWDIYLPLCQSRGDSLSQAFQTIPYIQLHRSQGGIFLHASHILQRSLRQKGVLAGALFSKNQVLCSQLCNSLTRKLLLLMMQSQFPSVEVDPDLELPGGVHLIYVYLSQEEYETLCHRRRGKYSSSSSKSESPNACNDCLENSVFTDSAISSGGEQVRCLSNFPNLNNDTVTDRSNLISSSLGFGDEKKRMKCDQSISGETRQNMNSSRNKKNSDDRKRSTLLSKAMVTSSTDSDVYVDTMSEFHQDEETCSKSLHLIKEENGSSKKFAENVNIAMNASSNVSGEFCRSVCEDLQEHSQSLVKETSCIESQEELVEDTKTKMMSIKGDTSPSSGMNVLSQSDSNLCRDNTHIHHQSDTSCSPIDRGMRYRSSTSDSIDRSYRQGSKDEDMDGNVGSSNKRDSKDESRALDKKNDVPDSNDFPPLSDERNYCQGEKEANNNYLGSDSLNQEKSNCHFSLKSVEQDAVKNVFTTKFAINLVPSAKGKKCENGYEKRDITTGTGFVKSMIQTQTGFEDSFTQNITGSGDDSSFNSSSEVRREDEDTSRKSSVISLANSDVASSKDRLTFDNLDSENSDCEIISPDPEIRYMSSEFEGKRIPAGRSSIKTADGSEAVFSHGSYHSCLDDETGSAGEMADPEYDNQDWTPKQDDLEELNLYIQGHSDTLLVLLVDKGVKCNKNFVHSLWKSCLSHLAELDFEVKNVERHMKDELENIGALYQFMKYDSFSHSLSGSAVIPVTSLANEMVDSCVRMHKDFDIMPGLIDATYRSHTACSFGRRSLNSETYFQVGLPSRGGINPGEKTFHLEQTAERCLAQDKNINLF